MEQASRTQENNLDIEVLNTADRLICGTLKQINQGYKSVTIEWAKKNCPKQWEQSLAPEEEINEAALEKNLEALKENLAK